MKLRRNWIIGAVLSTAAAVVALQSVSAPQQDSSLPPTHTSSPTEVETNTATEEPSAFQGCAYTWAYRDAPELTQAINAKVKGLNPNADAVATQFGEDCLKADGSVTFGVMQTDFKVRLPVDDLTREDDFGNWIAQVMQAVIEIPREDIPGPNFGFVEFRFEKNDAEHIALRVPIQEYLNNVQGKSGAELFQMFYTPPP